MSDHKTLGTSQPLTLHKANKHKSRWLPIIGVGIAALVLSGVVGFVLTMSVRQAGLLANRAKWSHNGARDYMAVIQMGGGTAGVAQNTLIVRRGRVVAQTGFHCVRTCDEAAFRGGVTPNIEGLFQTVTECNRWLFNCTVEYDDYFGYPRTIDQQCFSACSIAYTEVLYVWVKGTGKWA